MARKKGLKDFAYFICEQRIDFFELKRLLEDAMNERLVGVFVRYPPYQYQRVRERLKPEVKVTHLDMLMRLTRPTPVILVDEKSEEELPVIFWSSWKFSLNSFSSILLAAVDLTGEEYVVLLELSGLKQVSLKEFLEFLREKERKRELRLINQRHYEKALKILRGRRYAASA